MTKPQNKRAQKKKTWWQRIQAERVPTVKVWIFSRPVTFWLYFIVGVGVVIANVFTFTPDFVQTNLKFLLAVVSIGILLLMIAMLGELMPKTRGLRESLLEVRKDQFVDAGIRKLEKEPPRTWSRVAWCTEETLSIVAEQRSAMPWKRILRFLAKVSTVILLLAVIIRLLVLASPTGRFGLKADSSFTSHLSTSVLGLVTFGNGILQFNDFADISNKIIFQAGVSLLSIMTLGLGINLLAGSLDETNFMNHLYCAVRTHFEYRTEAPDRLPKLGTRLRKAK